MRAPTVRDGGSYPPAFAGYARAQRWVRMGGVVISLDWEEGLFKGFYRLWHRMREQGVQPGGVSLGSMTDRCQIVAQLVAGRPLQVRQAEGVGGIRGDVLLLPAAVNIGPTPEADMALFLLRAVHNGALVASWANQGAVHVGMAGRVRYLFAAQRAHQYLADLFDGWSAAAEQVLLRELAVRPDPANLSPAAAELEWLRRVLAQGDVLDEKAQRERFDQMVEPPDLAPGLLLWGETLTAADIHNAMEAAAQLNPEAAAGDGTEIKAGPKDFVTLTCLERVDEVPPLPLHTFEKTETLDVYRGGSRQVDGDDELEEHLEALQELDLREVIRGGAETRGFYQADIELGDAIPDIHHIGPDEVGLRYPEWHHNTQSYRQDWAMVYPTPVPAQRVDEALVILKSQRGRILRLRDRLLAHRTKNLRCTRQTQGDDLDLDAVVNAYADARAGRDPGEKLYLSQRKLQRDVAVTLLFDVSLSSGSWIDGVKVLDLTRETVLILGEVAAGLGDTLRILAFASNTRNHCRVFEIKNWREDWRLSLGRVCTLDPLGYTRIGPALRHATAGFDGVDARRRGLLLITDGKPTDYDRYEGRYGREDIRMAVKEARDQGVAVHALALDPSARRHLPAMFGVGGWKVLQHPNDLCDAVVTAYGRFHRG